MTNVTVTKDRYTVDSLYQWSKDQDLIITGLSLASIPEIHFTNDAMDKAIVRQATMDDAGVITARIPNSLLQKPYKIRAYVCIYEGDSFRSLYLITIPIEARSMPNDYTLTVGDDEVYSFNALENLVNNTVRTLTLSNSNLQEEVKRSNQTLETNLTKKCNDTVSAVNKSNEELQAELNQKYADAMESCEENLETQEQKFANDVQALTQTVNARVDNIIAHNNDTENNTELIDIRTGADGKIYNSAGEAVRKQVRNIFYQGYTVEMLHELGEFSPEITFYNKRLESDGTEAEDTSRRLLSDYIYIPHNAKLVETFAEGYTGYFAYYDENKAFIGAGSDYSTVDFSYVRLYMYKRNDIDITATEGLNNVTIVLTYSDPNLDREISGVYGKLDTFAKKVVFKNLLNVEESVDGYFNGNGTIANSTTYRTSGFIPISKGESITISPSLRKFFAYDITKNIISDSYVDAYTENYTYTATQDGYIRFSYGTGNENITQAEYGTEVTEYTEYGLVLEPGVNALNEKTKSALEKVIEEQFTSSNIQSLGNVLYGKKWVACGDSFTEGDFTNSPTNDYVFTEGLYEGKYKVYPFFIGNRNNMEVINEAKCGSTMAYVDGNQREFSTPNGRYTQIPTDADYITLKFGINDIHNNVPIGNIDDTVNTTFYGAWNIVMSYLLTNCPYAKIGIIVSNGVTEEYANATIAIAKRWGVSYLDMATGTNIPVMLRTARTDVCEEMKSILNNKFAVLWGTNGHPNEKAHEYESTIVEHWLRSL